MNGVNFKTLQRGDTSSSMNPEDALVREGRLTPRPRQRWTSVTVARIDFNKLNTALSSQLVNILKNHQPMRAQFDSTSTEIDGAISDCITELCKQAMNELWNRLRFISNTYSPDTQKNLFGIKAPTFEGFELPCLVASLLSGIGPLRIEDSIYDTIVIYAPPSPTPTPPTPTTPTPTPTPPTPTLPTPPPPIPYFAVNSLSVSRAITALRATNIPLGTIQHRGSVGAFFTTCSLQTVDTDSNDIYSAFHYSHYTRNDVIMAMFFKAWGDPSNPFEDMSFTLGFIDDETIVNGIENLPVNDAAKNGNPKPEDTRHVLGDYNIDYRGTSPASGTQGKKGVYILGRGFDRKFHYSLARGLSNLEIEGCLRHRILTPPPYKS